MKIWITERKVYMAPVRIERGPGACLRQQPARALAGVEIGCEPADDCWARWALKVRNSASAARKSSRTEACQPL